MSKVDIKEIIHTKKAWVYLRDILVGKLEKCDETPVVLNSLILKII